jgi:hypothetical protein
MRYFYVDPEVAGGLGKNTVLDNSVHPPIVRKLHYQFDGWLGDILLESFPIFIITDNAIKELQSEGMAGLRSEDLETTVSQQFRELYPQRLLPRFVWLQVIGRPGHDDFGTDSSGRLVVSEAALQTLNRLGIKNAEVADYPAS